MYIPDDIVKLIYSFVDYCIDCKIVMIDQYKYYNDNNKVLCKKCSMEYKICKDCVCCYKTTLYCRMCSTNCKYLCKNCIK